MYRHGGGNICQCQSVPMVGNCECVGLVWPRKGPRGGSVQCSSATRTGTRAAPDGGQVETVQRRLINIRFADRLLVMIGKGEGGWDSAMLVGEATNDARPRGLLIDAQHDATGDNVKQPQASPQLVLVSRRG